MLVQSKQLVAHARQQIGRTLSLLTWYQRGVESLNGAGDGNGSSSLEHLMSCSLSSADCGLHVRWAVSAPAG